MFWTLQEAQEFYQLWVDAYKQVTMGYTYSISIGGDTQTLTRNEMGKIKTEMLYWKRIIDGIQKDTSNNGRLINVGANY